jgi:anti-sigma B factor antagonist
MEITTHAIDQVTVLTLAGDIDGKTAPQAQEQVLPYCQRGSQLVLDMRGVAYMSSAGLRMMLALYRRTTSMAGRMVLVGLADEVRDTMQATGFLDYFTTCATLEEGVAAVQDEGAASA